MVTIEMRYEGQLRCQGKHGPSGESLKTDAPVDNQGRGEAFSPTDLVATAMGSCAMTIMGIYANREGINLEGLGVRVNKIMTTEGPRRIDRIELEFTMPAGLDSDDRLALERCVEVCPVRRSLNPAIEIPATFSYPD